MNKFIIALVASAASANQWGYQRQHQHQHQPAAKAPWQNTQNRGHYYPQHYYRKPTYVTPAPYAYPSSHYATPPAINGSGSNGGGDNGGGDNGGGDNGGGATATEFVCAATCAFSGSMDVYTATFSAMPDGNGGSMTMLSQTLSDAAGPSTYTTTANTFAGQTSGSVGVCTDVGDALMDITISDLMTDGNGDATGMDMMLTKPLLDLLGRSIVLVESMSTQCCTIGRAPDSGDCPQPEAATNGGATNGGATNGGATNGGATNGGGTSDQTATHVAAQMAHHQALHTANLPHNHGHYAKPVYTAYQPVKQPAYHGGYYTNQYRQAYYQPKAQSHYGSTHHGHHGHHGHYGHQGHQQRKW